MAVISYQATHASSDNWNNEYNKYNLLLLCQCTDNANMLPISTYINIVCVQVCVDGWVGGVMHVVCVRGPS